VTAMKDKSKLYFLLFAFSVISLIAAIVLKLCGIGWFDSSPAFNPTYSLTDKIINFFYFVVQGYLIVGCCTWITPKKLIQAYAPFIPLCALLFFIPSRYYIAACFSITFAICFSISPLFSSIIKWILGVICINLIQLGLLWVKFSIFKLSPTNVDIQSLLLNSIDQFIILSLFYYFNVKCGDKIVVVLFRKNR
jgi:hypothetical protein